MNACIFLHNTFDYNSKPHMTNIPPILGYGTHYFIPVRSSSRDSRNRFSVYFLFTLGNRQLTVISERVLKRFAFHVKKADNAFLDLTFT